MPKGSKAAGVVAFASIHIVHTGPFGTKIDPASSLETTIDQAAVKRAGIDGRCCM